ncbi:MAG: hypothetical protein BTN85_1545 [Candidatus Methanohalarchaeum thermophilum]|uniref:Uncharacterized protein n=1 Tax=Methanohalarchaeum thermophilum TaxID=1903181 RepID=A0A1Q6DXE0_METT1|nr:MAG: hypothetical protein BTN85_1545 [Candidatus Methanohalarchaeum thermophilum]
MLPDFRIEALASKRDSFRLVLPLSTGFKDSELTRNSEYNFILAFINNLPFIPPLKQVGFLVKIGNQTSNEQIPRKTQTKRTPQLSFILEKRQIQGRKS